MERYVPLPDLRQNSGSIDSSLKLPFSVENEIGADSLKILLLMQIGGIRRLQMQNQSIPQKSASVEITGFSRSGEATAGKVDEEIIPSRSVGYINKQRYGTKQAQWIDPLSFIVDPEVMKTKILREGQDLRNPAVWATEINSGLKKAVQGVGERHLLGGLTVSDRFLFGFNSLYSVFIGAMQLPAERVTEMVESYFLFNFCSYIGKALCYGLESLGTGSRLSMFAGIEIDRALILRAASSSGKLVKKLE